MHNLDESRLITKPQLMAANQMALNRELTGDDFANALDVGTISYVLAAQKPFRKLRQAISQIVGALVLDATSRQGNDVSEQGY